MLGLLFAAAALLAVPARGYLEQRGRVADREVQLAEIERINADLGEQLELLEDPDEIRRIARRDYGLVEPGQESYSVLPPATAGLVLPSGWPFDRLSGPLERAASGGS